MAYRTLREAVFSQLVPGEIHVLGVTGQAGAGKTSRVAPLISQMVSESGYWTATLPLDAFFKQSSEERKKWLAEGEATGEEEAARRRDQMTWWDFRHVENVLFAVKDGQPIKLTGVYNRADQGRLTSEISITPGEQGGLLLFEGVAIAHVALVTTSLYAYAPADVRLQRLRDRDRHRGPEEAQKRFALTEEFEENYFRRYWKFIDLCVDNRVQGDASQADLPLIAKPEEFYFADLE